ncbi:hypothetical protein SDC9_152548 [bioreactor metagenome]|uniref:Uncharacterized protein n=1 Tax=bioreactor metagenome TaxID=1076179 RepID=A0A645ETC8_9ZZZZ
MGTFLREQPTALIIYDEPLVRRLIEKVTVYTAKALYANLNVGRLCSLCFHNFLRRLHFYNYYLLAISV